MARIIAFGCSFTKGWDLPDQWAAHDYSNVRPSTYAWPNQLAQKINYDIVNLGKGGLGNTLIVEQILQFDFLSTDLVLIGWSYFQRSMFVNFKTSVPHELLKYPKNHSEENFDEDNAVENYHYINLAHYYLASKNILSFSLPMTSCYYKYKTPKHLQHPNVITSFKAFDCYIVDKAGDQRHPGPISHSLIADKIYEIIKEHVIH